MRIDLNQGFYESRSVVAEAQRCVNLFPERNPPDAPFPFTHYLTPGLTELCQGIQGKWRCLYRDSTGYLYGVLNQSVYYIDTTWNLHLVGNLTPANPVGLLGSGVIAFGQVSMADNGNVVVIVDGTPNGYYIAMTGNVLTRAFGTITTPAFYGSDFVGYVDTFFVFNYPGSQDFYISASNLTVALITGGSVATGTISGQGINYSNGTHLSVPLIGGSGAGATANITVALGQVVGVDILPGQISAPYQAGDILTADAQSIGGGVTGGDVIDGAGYTAGTYSNVAVLGGTGTNAKATITVNASGAVTTVVFVNQGQDYTVGDVLTARSGLLGNSGAGFSFVVGSVNNVGSGFSYTVSTVNAGVIGFDSLDIASKTGAQDELGAAIVIHREIWLLGLNTTEVWYNAGNADFAYQALPGVFIQHGLAAKYSIAQADLSLFWLCHDPQGNTIVMQGTEYAAKRISTHAIEAKLRSYVNINDAVGFTYQQDGHVFYVLSFPTADATWVYDLAEGLWHERVFVDNNGFEHRWRPNCQAEAYGVNVVGDWQNGKLYAIDLSSYTDENQVIVRRRSFPQVVNEGKRLSVDRFVAEMAPGDVTGTGTVIVLDQQLATDTTLANWLGVTNATTDGVRVIPGDLPPGVTLRVSTDRGASWGMPMVRSLGATGQTDLSLQWRQVAYGRYLVFELSWAGNFPTALNGAFVDVTAAET